MLSDEANRLALALSTRFVLGERIVMDLFSRKRIGWTTSSTLKTDLIIQSLKQAYNLRKPRNKLIFYSDRGSQYTSEAFNKLLHKTNIIPSMGDVGACWDHAVVERFFGTLKHDWLFKNSRKFTS